jgi:hypothetical protein
MAVVTFSELPQRTGGTQADFKRRYTRVFQVYSDDRDDGPVTVAAAIGLGIGSTYSCGNDTDLGSFVQSIEARETGELLAGMGLLWHVTVQYDGVDPTQDGEADDNPLNKPVEWRYGTNRFERVVDKDVSGVAVLNTAGQPFDPPLVIDDSRPVIQATRNEATFSPAAAYAYKDVVNSATWFGGAAKTWKCNAITAKREWHGTLEYYVVDYEFEYNPNTWQKVILNQGMCEKVSGALKAITTSDGTPISQPVPLASNGTKIAASSLPGSAVWLTFDVYPSVAFSVFNLE